MLQKSNVNFPFSIAMVQSVGAGKTLVIGHSRLCMVSGREDCAFVDSGKLFLCKILFKVFGIFIVFEIIYNPDKQHNLDKCV